MYLHCRCQHWRSLGCHHHCCCCCHYCCPCFQSLQHRRCQLQSHTTHNAFREHLHAGCNEDQDAKCAHQLQCHLGITSVFRKSWDMASGKTPCMCDATGTLKQIFALATNDQDMNRPYTCMQGVKTSQGGAFHRQSETWRTLHQG